MSNLTQPLLSSTAGAPVEAAGSPAQKYTGATWVQFLSNREFSVEGGVSGDVLKIEVVRVGDSSTKCSVSYFTSDRSAKEGKKYKAATGTVDFEPGDIVKFIDVTLLNDDTYVPVCDFVVELSQPVDCGLVVKKNQCRVTMADDDLFPSNRVKEYIQDGGIKQMPIPVLLKDFYRFVLSNGAVGKKARIILIGDQIHNLYTLGMNYLNAYLINNVLTVKDGEYLLTGERYSTLYLLAICTVAPYAVFFFWERFKAKMGLANELSGFLKGAVIRTYFNLNDDVRSRLHPTHVNAILANQTDAVAQKTFGGAFKLSQAAGAIAVSLFFTLKKSPGFFPFLVGIVSIFSYIMWFEIPSVPKGGDATKVKMSVAERLTQVVTHVANHHRLIMDYDRVSYETDKLNALLQENTDSGIKGDIGGLPKKYMPTALCQVLAAVYIAVAGSEVLLGRMQLGGFVVTLTIIGATGKLLKSVQGSVMTVLGSVKALMSITDFLRLEVDVKERSRSTQENKKEHHSKRVQASQLRDSFPADSEMKNVPVRDMMAIEVIGVSMSYHGNKVVTDFTAALRQGTVTSVQGPHSSGKRTLIKVLSRILWPQEGHVFVPTHLDTLHMDKSPDFFHSKSYMDNLTYGVLQKQSKPRVEAVLRDVIGIAEGEQKEHMLITLLNNPVDHWWKQLTATDMCLMHLARGLILNLEFLVMERILDMFHKERFLKLLALLRRHVDERGLHETEPLESRRPRTLVFATLNIFKESKDAQFPTPPQIDYVWTTDTEGIVKVREVSKR